MRIGKLRVQPRQQLFEYAPEPKRSARRMRCRTCGAAPGEKCQSGVGQQMRYVHKSRRLDFRKLREIEGKVADWNARYPAQGKVNVG